MALGGHPDHGMSGTSTGHEAGSGMESEYGGQAIGVYGGLESGQNEMSAFLDAMRQRYGMESVTNYIDTYITGRLKEVEFPNPAQGFRDFNYGSQTTPLGHQAPVMGIEDENRQTPTLDYGVPPGVMSNPSPVNPELQMSGRLTHAQLAALDAAQASTQNFTQFDQAFIDQMMESNTPNVGPEYGGGGDRYIPLRRNRGMIGRDDR
jgi:hypothetical protein